MVSIKVAAVAFQGSYDPQLNLKSHMETLDELAGSGFDLIVFPEVSLHGYPPEVARIYPAKLAEVYRSAQPVPDGESVTALLEHAAALGVHVVFGCHELGNAPGAVYNTAVLGGPNGYIGKYRKVHLGITEQPVWRPGSDWPVFDTDLGKIGMLICYDDLFPESARELTLRGAELLVHPMAGPRVLYQGHAARDSEKENFVVGNFLISQTRAAENSRWVITSNYGGFLGDAEFTGLARIIDPRGRVLACTQPALPGIAAAEIDVIEGIASAYAELFGARLIRDRRPETYDVLSGRISPTLEA